MSHHQHQHQHGSIPMVGAMSRGQFARIIFPIALSMILFVAYSILVHIYSLNLDTKELPIDAMLFCVVWSLLLCSFLRGAFSSPGLVEKEWYKRYPAMHKSLKIKYKVYKEQMAKNKEMMKRFNLHKKQQHTECNDDKCNDNKCNDNSEETRLLIKEEGDDDSDEVIFPLHWARPPRSHFCHELNSNVLRMDHFCVWFNNAVGFNNYKYFLLTIIYLFISCLLSIYILIYRVFINAIQSEYGLFDVICLLLSLIICVFFTVFGAMHSSMHLWQMLHNLTSIESHKYMQIKAMAKHFNVPFLNTHEFDDGLWRNCTKMVGKDVWFWLVPIAPSLPEDGYHFHVNNENKQRIESITKAIQTKREEVWKKSKLNTKH